MLSNTAIILFSQTPLSDNAQKLAVISNGLVDRLSGSTPSTDWRNVV